MLEIRCHPRQSDLWRSDCNGKIKQCFNGYSLFLTHFFRQWFYFDWLPLKVNFKLMMDKKSLYLFSFLIVGCRKGKRILIERKQSLLNFRSLSLVVGTVMIHND